MMYIYIYVCVCIYIYTYIYIYIYIYVYRDYMALLLSSLFDIQASVLSSLVKGEYRALAVKMHMGDEAVSLRVLMGLGKDHG